MTENLSEEPIVLVPLLELDEAAAKLLEIYEASGRAGATFSLRFGDMNGKSLYSVSVWPDRARKFNGDAVSDRVVQAFISENLQLLGDPRGCVGLWYNDDENITYLDVVATLPDFQEAKALALQYDQIAIFDLQNLTEIETGGTGNTPENMPPVAERLSKIIPQDKEER